MKLYEIVFTFLDPSQAMGTVMADSAEEAIEKIKNDIAENSPGIEDLKIVSVTEVVDHPVASEDIDANRTLN